MPRRKLARCGRGGEPLLNSSTLNDPAVHDPRMSFFILFTDTSAKPFDCEYPAEETPWLMLQSRKNVLNSSDVNWGPPSDQNLTGAPAPKEKKNRIASTILRAVVFLSGKGMTWGQPLK